MALWPQLLSFLEQRRLPYIVIARMTRWVQRAAQRVEQWQVLDENYALSRVPLAALELEAPATLHRRARTRS
ncbi:MAG: hypothetical protein WAM39_20610 [Bryobacteraceae bacterium]